MHFLKDLLIGKLFWTLLWLEIWERLGLESTILSWLWRLFASLFLFKILKWWHSFKTDWILIHICYGTEHLYPLITFFTSWGIEFICFLRKFDRESKIPFTCSNLTRHFSKERFTLFTLTFLYFLLYVLFCEKGARNEFCLFMTFMPHFILSILEEVAEGTSKLYLETALVEILSLEHGHVFYTLNYISAYALRSDFCVLCLISLFAETSPTCLLLRIPLIVFLIFLSLLKAINPNLSFFVWPRDKDKLALHCL